MLFRWHRVLDSQDELHVRAIVNQSFIDQAACSMDVRQIEDFDLGPDTVLAHACREISDQAGRIFIRDRWEVDRTCRERAHVWLEIKRTAAGTRITAAAAGGKLNDYPWAKLSYALLDASEKFRA